MVVEKVFDLMFRAFDVLDAARSRLKGKAIVSKPIGRHSPQAQVQKPAVPRKKASLKNATVTKKLDSSRSAKGFRSERASQIWQRLQVQGARVVSDSAEIDGKKSLAWVMWAIGTAEESAIPDGISVHDVSALLFHAAKIQIYPINVSRMVHDHAHYIRQASQEKRTKRYLLTDEGRKRMAQLSFR
jgi:hypothetical protein